MSMRIAAIAVLFWIGSAWASEQPKYSQLAEGDFVMKNFKFASGEILSEVRIHYRTLGQPERDKAGIVRNAVLILHGTGGQGGAFLSRDQFAGELFGKGQTLDAARFYLVMPDNLGHGKSSKPSDGLHARFPRYGYQDMLEAQYRLVTEGLKVNHLRLVMGTSMGGMHTWLWGQRYPDFMDALFPLASLPTQISGPSLRLAAQMLFLMSSNPVIRQKQGPTLKEADEFFEKSVTTALATQDANDQLYAIESSRDYDPGPDLEKIRVPLLAINSADDLINPPELGILEREIQRVKRGRAIVIPLSDATVGHGTHSSAVVWKHHLDQLLKESSH
jgi:homoserine O-acetyltransferase